MTVNTFLEGQYFLTSLQEIVPHLFKKLIFGNKIPSLSSIIQLKQLIFQQKSKLAENVAVKAWF